MTLCIEGPSLFSNGVLVFNSGVVSFFQINLNPAFSKSVACTLDKSSRFTIKYPLCANSWFISCNALSGF